MNPTAIASKKRFAEIQNELQAAGIITGIKRYNHKNYDVSVNYEVVKHYKQRRSCRRFVIKLWNSKFSNDEK